MFLCQEWLSFEIVGFNGLMLLYSHVYLSTVKFLFAYISVTMLLHIRYSHVLIVDCTTLCALRVRYVVMFETKRWGLWDWCRLWMVGCRVLVPDAINCLGHLQMSATTQAVGFKWSRTCHVCVLRRVEIWFDLRNCQKSWSENQGCE